jgi:hypothetical protein
MKGQFFIVATVIMVITLMALVRYFYGFSGINLQGIKEKSELNYIPFIKDSMNEVINSFNGDCDKLRTDLEYTKNFLESSMIKRGMSLDIIYVFNCPPPDISFVFQIKSSSILIETGLYQSDTFHGDATSQCDLACQVRPEGFTTGICTSECSGTSIGQDGCASGETCCCSGTAPPSEPPSEGTPVPPTAKNLEVIPENWSDPYKSNQIGDRPGEIIYPSDSYNGFSSIELREDNTDGWKAEVNGDWLRIYPGDRIIMRSMIKTTSGTAYTNSGARIALDYYSGTARINGPSSAGEAAAGTSWVDNNNFAAENEANFVKWGQTSWVLREWDFIVPDIVIADGLLGYPQGQEVVPVGMAPWMQVMGTDVEDNAGYFANFELFIYRSGAWL